MSLIAPRASNGFIPHILRARWFLALGFLAMWSMYVAASYSEVLRSEMFSAQVISADAVAYTNQTRLAYQETPLRYNAQLERAAQLKANDMVAQGYFAHVSPTGAGAWTFLQQVDYQYEFAGENLAVNFGSADEVVRAWMNSPTHRANILNQDFNEIGIATAEGMYKGKLATFVVQIFGKNAQPVFAADFGMVGTEDNVMQSAAPTISQQLLQSARQAGAQAIGIISDPRSIAGLPMVAVSILVILAIASFPAMRKKHRIGALLSGLGLIGFSMLLLAVSQYILMPVIL